jgi:uncharacterized protein YgbK (DUF1537 family)
MPIRIITDDFTSATDGVAAFAQRGWPTAVAMGDGFDHTLPVLSVDTDSRLCPAPEAAERVAPWARRWAHASVLVKQFDSTLRGPFAHECKSVWTHSGKARMLVVPAFPAAGRTLKNGVVLLHGRPVHESAFGQDPLNPVVHSALTGYFAQAGVHLHTANNLDAARAAFAAGCTAVALDIQTEVQLTEAAQQFVGHSDLLWAGSTGVVRALAGAMMPDSAAAPLPWQPCAAPWVLVGSLNPVSHQQAMTLTTSVIQQCPQVRLLATSTQRADPRSATQGMVAQLAQAIRNRQCDGVVVTGGETAKALAHALQATQLRVLQDIEPGVPLCLMQVAGQWLPLISKAGGFGNPHTLARCALFLLKGSV